MIIWGGRLVGTFDMNTLTVFCVFAARLARQLKLLLLLLWRRLVKKSFSLSLCPQSSSLSGSPGPRRPKTQRAALLLMLIIPEMDSLFMHVQPPQKRSNSALPGKKRVHRRWNYILLGTLKRGKSRFGAILEL